MKRKYKKLWLEALRGGKFEQGPGRLRKRNNKCCCLGVLCDLVDPDKWHYTRGDSVWVHKYDDYDVHTAMPSDELLRKAGLSYRYAEHLANMNDSGKSFGQIADYIEQNL